MNDEDSITLNQAVPDVNQALIGAHGVPDAFAARLLCLKQACGNVQREDRFKQTFIQRLLELFQVKAQKDNLQFTKHTLKQLSATTRRQNEQIDGVKALHRFHLKPPNTCMAERASRAGLKTPVFAAGEFESQAGGRLEGWRRPVTPSNSHVTWGRERPNQVRECWLCNNEVGVRGWGPGFCCRSIGHRAQTRCSQQNTSAAGLARTRPARADSHADCGRLGAATHGPRLAPPHHTDT